MTIQGRSGPCEPLSISHLREILLSQLELLPGENPRSQICDYEVLRSVAQDVRVLNTLHLCPLVMT